MEPVEGEVRINKRDPNRRAIFTNGVWVEQAPISKGPPKLAVPLQRDELGEAGEIQAAVEMNGMLDRTRDQLEGGGLELGPVKNLVSRAQNFMGASTPSSRNYASFKSNLEKLRNESLRLNKGVQTEGDAQRAWNELFTNLNDEELVKQRLGEVEAINQRAVAARQSRMQLRRQSQNVGPIDTNVFTLGSRQNPHDLSRGEARETIPPGVYYRDPWGNVRRNDNGSAGNPKIDPRTGRQIQEAAGPARRAPTGSVPVRVSSPEEADALAPGTVFITPDGRRKVR